MSPGRLTPSHLPHSAHPTASAPLPKLLAPLHHQESGLPPLADRKDFARTSSVSCTLAVPSTAAPRHSPQLLIHQVRKPAQSHPGQTVRAQPPGRASTAQPPSRASTAQPPSTASTAQPPPLSFLAVPLLFSLSIMPPLLSLHHPASQQCLHYSASIIQPPCRACTTQPPLLSLPAGPPPPSLPALHGRLPQALW